MPKDIRLSVGFPRHFKTEALIDQCGIEAAWGLIRLWCYCGELKPDGNLSSLSVDKIASICGFSDRTIIDKLVEIGWLDDDGNGLRLHDWDHHNPFAAFANQRSAMARRSVEHRWGKQPSDNKPVANQSSDKSNELAFEKFWEALPQGKRMNKYMAQQEWCVLSETIDMVAELPKILSALEWQSKRNNGKYLVAPVRYLSERRWNDERPADFIDPETDPLALGSEKVFGHESRRNHK